jgi:hypothetical protein
VRIAIPVDFGIAMTRMAAQRAGGGNQERFASSAEVLMSPCPFQTCAQGVTLTALPASLK